MILRQFKVGFIKDVNILGFINVFLGLFFCKQKDTMVFKLQEDVIFALSSTELCLSFLKF